MNEIQDFMQDGKCSGCGNCCTNYLPLTDAEFRQLKRWVRRKQFVPKPATSVSGVDHVLSSGDDFTTSNWIIDATCPFLDKETNRCVCYDTRPEICRVFSCHDVSLGRQELPKYAAKMQIHNLRRELFNQDTPTYEEFQLLVEYIKSRPKAGESLG